MAQNPFFAAGILEGNIPELDFIVNIVPLLNCQGTLIHIVGHFQIRKGFFQVLVVVPKFTDVTSQFRYCIHKLLNGTLVQNEVTNTDHTDPGFCSSEDKYDNLHHKIQQMLTSCLGCHCAFKNLNPSGTHHMLLKFCQENAVQFENMHIRALCFHVAEYHIVCRRKLRQCTVDLGNGTGCQFHGNIRIGYNHCHKHQRCPRRVHKTKETAMLSRCYLEQRNRQNHRQNDIHQLSEDVAGKEDNLGQTRRSCIHYRMDSRTGQCYLRVFQMLILKIICRIE